MYVQMYQEIPIDELGADLFEELLVLNKDVSEESDPLEILLRFEEYGQAIV